MKKTLIVMSSVAAFFTQSNAQNPCSTGRYASNTFTAVTITSGIAYGANITAGGSNQILTMDVYQPTGDVETNRPLIILAHGGSFIFGSSTTSDMVTLSTEFAKKGFVCVSINYRLGLTPFDSTGAIKAVLRAAQDMKASIRFFYKDKLTTNIYKIDTTNIFIGGSSAGAITALHTAYLKRSCQITTYISQTNLTALGDLNGNSGNPCYSTKVKGVINLCGALGTANWLEAGDIPLVSMHGTIDGTVKYGRGKVNPGVPIMYLDGSRVIKQKATAVGVNNSFYTFNNADHVPFMSGGTAVTQAAYMDTTIKFVRDFLVAQLGCTVTPLQAPNTPFGTATLIPFTACTSNTQQNFCTAQSIKTFETNLVQTIYPNPSSDKVTLVFVNSNTEHTITLMDITGKIVKSDKTMASEFTFEKSNIQSGIYFLKITESNGQSSVHKIIFN